MMSGFSHFLLSFCILGCMACSSTAWHVKLPSNIKGLLHSCLVIPCSFDYFQYPPRRPDRVVWYQYVSRGYPLVYDNWYPNNVISTYKHRTSRAFISRYGKDCSLEISSVKWSDHRQKIYPWVDPENVGRGTYRFFDTTVTIEVVDQADKPDILIFGNMMVGQSVTVQCSVYHTCPTNPPSLSFNTQKQNRQTQTSLSNGMYKTTLTSTINIYTDFQTVDCSVRHKGGITARSSKILKSECSFSPLTIQPTNEEFLEGQAKTVTCTALFTCSKHMPTLTWNYAGMPASTDNRKIGNAQWRTVSRLTLTASAADHGKTLTCIAIFTGGLKQVVDITLRVKRNMLLRDWSFTTPSIITGIKGSCIIIPCRFSYSISQPKDLYVIWYLFQSYGYLPVFDEKQNVISKIIGKTSVIGSVGERNCSLKIERLEMSHNQVRLFPWIDKNSITAYYTVGHTFYDKTTQLIVSDHAHKPQLSIIEIPRVEKQSRVSCSVQHTCISAPPTLTLTGIRGTDNTMDTLVSDGIWERKIERSWTVKEEDQAVQCTVSYQSGQKATSEVELNVECPYEEIAMIEQPGVTTEGVAKSVICSVSYKCKKNTPTIEWNYKDMQSSSHTKKISSNTYNTVSNLTFIGSLEDEGNSLTCTAQFITGETSDSAILHIKKYVKPVEEIDPHENDTFHVLAAHVPFRISALTSSCVVIPCSFQYEEDEPLTRGIWSKKKGGVIYHNGQSYVLDHFKGRTRLLGDLHEGDCTLEIDNIKPFDNGPFCFHAERGNDKYRFNNSCVFIVMKASPEKPVMTQVPAEIEAGSTITVSCFVNHTCPSHHPEFSWSVPTLTSEGTQTQTSQGMWETTSTITFMAAGGDGVKNLTCTANFWNDKQRATTFKLTVKGSLKYQIRSSLPVAIPVSALVLIAILAVVICRKRRHSDDSLRPPPRPEKRRSLWGRLSRHSEDRERPPRPEKRKSMWSRFSRRSEDGRVQWQNERKPRNDTTAVHYSNQTSKPRFPSPKNNRRPPRSVRPEFSSAVGV